MSDQASLFDAVDTGQARRDRGIARVWDNTDETWRTAALLAIGELAAIGEPFTAEDVRERAGDPPHPNAMGAAIRTAAIRGWIHKAGLRKATRPERHANDHALWQGNRPRIRTVATSEDYL